MADVARQVLTLMAAGSTEGVVMINTLKFPHSGAPQLILQRVSDYLTSSGVAVIDLSYVPDAYQCTYRVRFTDSFDPAIFGEKYQQYLGG